MSPYPAGHFLGLLVLWLVVPVQIIRWRLVKRAEGLGFSGPSRIGWLAVVSTAAFVPWIGYAAITGKDLGMVLLMFGPGRVATQLQPVLWPLGVPALWLSGVAARAQFGRADCHFHRVAAARVLVVNLAAALGGPCVASQGFKC